jgi:trehalose-6-phosphate synthase
LRRVWLSDEEEREYYDGFSNSALWPLCHRTYVQPMFRSDDFNTYRGVNERFAGAVAEEATSRTPVVLVQDYHFALAPLMIRQRLPSAAVATFWHIPWPHWQTFAACPWRDAHAWASRMVGDVLDTCNAEQAEKSSLSVTRAPSLSYAVRA